MSVNVASGQIYAMASIDATAYSSLAIDVSHTILKQGVILDATILSCPAPSTSGYSINYLIEIGFSETDGDSTVLPYYNSSDPSISYSGPNNSGQAQYTTRKGICSVVLKSGVAATTGSQSTPSPDSGYVGAWVVTVAYGATQITASNISKYSAAPFVDSILNHSYYTESTGSSNAYVLALQPPLVAYIPGLPITFKANFVNIGAATLAVNGLSALTLKKNVNEDLAAGDIKTGQIVVCAYDGTNLQVVSLGGGGAAEKWGRLISGTDFSTTPPTSSTIVMNTDQTPNIPIGTGVKYKASGSYYRGQVTALTANLMTISGAPLPTSSGALTELYYLTEPLIQMEFLVPGYYEDASDTTLLLNDILTAPVWGGRTSYCIGIGAKHRVVDSGASQPQVNFRINGSDVLSTALTMSSSANTMVWAVVAFNTSNYDIQFREGMEISVTKGTNGDARDLYLIALYIPE